MELWEDLNSNTAVDGHRPKTRGEPPQKNGDTMHTEATAKAEREGKHVKPSAMGDKCGFCGHYGQGCSGQEKAVTA
jgi:hypothetical protein